MSAAVSVDVLDHEGQTVVKVSGEIDMTVVGALQDAIEANLGPHQTIVLDLANVAFTDSSLVKVLAHARTRVSDDGGSLILRNPSPAARRILSLAEAQTLVDAIEDGSSDV